MTVEAKPADEAAVPLADLADPSDDSTDEASLSAQNGEPSNQAEADERVSELDAELVSLREKAEKAEKRIPGLQQLIAARERERDAAKEESTTYRQSMLEWTRGTMLRNGLEDEWKAIEQHEQERTGKVLETQASRAETLEIINDLLDSDDAHEREFARFIKGQVRVASEGGVPVKVTKGNLGTYRQMYAAARGEAAPAAPAEALKATAKPAPAPAKKPLPKVVAASGAPQTTEEPAWKPGVTPRDLFNRAFRGGREA